MSTITPVSSDFDAVIADLQKRREVFQRAIDNIDQAISSLQNIPQIMAGFFTSTGVPVIIPQQEEEEGEMIDVIEELPPIPLKQEILNIVDWVSGDISQPIILAQLLSKYPDYEQKAKVSQWSARIAGELKKLEEAGRLVLVRKNYSNFPSVFRKKEEVEQTEAQNMAA